MANLKKTLQSESQKLIDTTAIGYYTTSPMGLPFNFDMFTKLFQHYKDFKNSICIIYDVTKAKIGMNPIKAYRLSQKIILAMEYRPFEVVPTITEEKISNFGLTYSEMFEEIPIKIYRSHLVQAYLLDHISP